MAEPLAEPENKFRTFYHGTYPGRIESILRTGLDPNYAGQGGGTLPGLNEKDPRPKLFLTTSPSYAKFYARMAAGMEAQAKAKEEGKGWFRQRLAQGTPAPPLRIDLPSDFKVHELAGPGWIVPGDEHYVTDLIPPEYIKAMNRLEKAAAFGAIMGKMAADPRILNAPYSKSPNSNGVTQVANSPAQDTRMRSSHADAEAELFGLRAPLGFSREMYKHREGYARNKNPKANVNRDGGMQIPRIDDTPASPWRSGYTSPKVDDIQNEKHYNEMANMNRANPPKNINGVPAARARLSNQQNSNAAEVLPYLAGKKFK